MKYFTIGPVQMSPRVAAAGGVQAAYFRDEEFADRVVVAQDEILRLFDAPVGSALAVMSSSGTGGMEAALLNFTRRGDPVLVVNGGSFGKRFADLARFHGREVTDIRPGLGRDLDLDTLATAMNETRFAAVLMNAHETSTGQKYDIAAVADLCRRTKTLLICDAVSTLACDPFTMRDLGVNVLVFSSNKGLALAPGLGFVAVDPEALARQSCTESFYFDLAPYLAGAKRGQPPFTSSVAVLMQLFERLDEIRQQGGIAHVTAAVAVRAQAFRDALAQQGIALFPQTPSNAITAFVLEKGTSDGLYDYLKSDHGLLINKSAWGLGVDVPRVSHVGDLTIDDHIELAHAIEGYLTCI